MQATGIDFNPGLPWGVLATVAVVGISILLFALISHACGIWWRAVFLCAGYLVLINPTLIREQRQYLPDIAALVIDQTLSQRTNNRLELATTVAEQLRVRLQKERDLELRSIVVDESNAGEGTRLFEALQEVLSDVPPERVAGSIIITDGQVHDVPKNSANIAYAGPIHVLLTGNRGELDRRLVIEEMPSYAIVGDSVAIAVRVDDINAEGEVIPITLRADGKDVLRTTVEIGVTNEIQIVLDHEGLTAFELYIEPGPSELTLDNNRAVALINGIRDRLRVMLVSGEPGPGLRTLRNLLKADPAVDLVHFTILRPPNKQDLTPVSELSLIPFPSGELFSVNLQKFDLVIFDRYHRRGILPAPYLSNLVDYVLAGGAVLDIAGPSFASSLSLATTPLAAILPARPTGKVYETAYRPRLSDEGGRHPVTTSLHTAGKGEMIAGDPPWGRWFRLIEAEIVRGEVLMRGAEDSPLLVLDRIGAGRVAQLLSDQSWLWARGFEGGGPQQDLLRRLVHWLMKQPDLEEESLSADVDQQRINISRRSLAPIKGPVTIIGPDGKSEDVTLVDVGGGRATATISVPRRGFYQLKHGEQSAVAMVGVANPLEVSDMRATEILVEPIATATGGSVVWLEEKGVPQVRRVRGTGNTMGPGWIGLVVNQQYRVSGLFQAPLLPEFLLLLLLLGGALMAWRVEGR